MVSFIFSGAPWAGLCNEMCAVSAGSSIGTAVFSEEEEIGAAAASLKAGSPHFRVTFFGI